MSLEKLKGYKTIAFFALTLLVSIASMVGFVEYTPSENDAEIIGIVLSFAALLLRYVTEGKIFLKSD